MVKREVARAEKGYNQIAGVGARQLATRSERERPLASNCLARTID